MQSLIFIRRSEVPAYLHDSELYLSLDDENDDDISVPSNCLKADTSVNSVSELDHLLSTVRFWIASPYKMEIINYATNKTSISVKRVIAGFKLAFPKLCDLLDDVRSPRTKLDCNVAAKHGCLELLKYLAERQKSLTVVTLRIAAQNGHLDCLSFCLDYIACTGYSNHIDLLDWGEVVRLGHLDCLKCLVQHGMPVRPKYHIIAASHNQVSCLQHLLSVCANRSNELLLVAVKKDHVNCLKCIVEQNGGCEVGPEVWEAAVKTTSSISSDNLLPTVSRCLQFLLVSSTPPGDTSIIVEIAIEHNNVDSLHLLHQRGCTVDSDSVIYAKKCSSFSSLQYLLYKCRSKCMTIRTMTEAVKFGFVDLVKQLHELGCPWDESAYIAALQNDQVDCLQYLIEQRGIPTSAAFRNIRPGKCMRLLLHLRELQLEKEITQEFARLRERMEQYSEAPLEKLQEFINSEFLVSTDTIKSLSESMAALQPYVRNL